MKIEIDASLIEDINELKSYQGNNFVECVGTGVGQELSVLWKNRNDFVMPGMKGKCRAVIYIVDIYGHNEAKKDISNIIMSFYESEYGKDNVLSIRQSQENNALKHIITIYPLNHRVLDTSPWFDENEIKEDFRLRLYKRISESLLVEIEDEQAAKSELATKIKNTKNLAEINLIDEMDLKEEDILDDEELIYDAAGMSRQVRIDTSFDKLDNAFVNTLKCFTVGAERIQFKKAQIGEVNPEEFAKNIQDYLQRYYDFLSTNDRNIIVDKVLTGVYGNYILEDLINDEAISDIKVIAPDDIRIKVNGKRMTSNLHFIDGNDYVRFIEGLGIRNNLDFREKAIHVFTDKYTNPNFILRFNITTPYINSVPYPYLHIRKIRKEKYSIDDLIRFQMMDRDVANYLISKAKHGKGIVFTGKGASGKTTIMNTLLEKIPKGNSGLIIQESDELFLKTHPDFMIQHVTEEYSLKELARNGLLTDLDYFIIGEIKGEEALYFLNAAATGHKCWCSVHSASSRDAIGKLADYVMYESKYNKEQALYMLKELDTIVFMNHFKVTEISEIIGWDDEKKELTYKTVYKR